MSVVDGACCAWVTQAYENKIRETVKTNIWLIVMNVVNYGDGVSTTSGLASTLRQTVKYCKLTIRIIETTKTYDNISAVEEGA